MLQQKNAIIYGAGGSLGGAVAIAFARAGARVFLAGRTLAPLQACAAEVFGVDATDSSAVGEFVARVAATAGSIDISFCAIGLQVVQNMPLTDISPEDFVRPVTLAMQSQFITATAAAKCMIKQHAGVILSLTATPGGIGYPFTGGFAPACAAIESFSRNLAAELGIYGIRVVNIRSGGSPDSAVFREAFARAPEEMNRVMEKMEGDTMLKKMPLMADIAQAAVFLCSAQATNVTGTTLDLTGGTTAGLNYKVQRPA